MKDDFPKPTKILKTTSTFTVDKKEVFSTKLLTVENYNLDYTLDSGQTFRWKKIGEGWEGVINGHWVRLEKHKQGIFAKVYGKVDNWHWLEDYLQVEVNLNEIVNTFPPDKYLNAAVAECRGLRIVKQEPWECLASFLMSSSKQIVQIKQIISNLCYRFGRKIKTASYCEQQYAFPEIETIAMADKLALRECKMGFRAAYLKKSAIYILKNRINLAGLSNLPVEDARNVLMELPGVGAKIANCVLLFSLGFYQAFPVDVWVKKALQQFYFDNNPTKNRELEEFASNYFGEYGGYAQQYLFHYIRTKLDTNRKPKK